jgi:hypothetical protein
MSKLQKEEEGNFFKKASRIERPISAPPDLMEDSMFSTTSLFATNSKYSSLFGDIRYEEEYEEFYNNYEDPSKLPAPLNLNIYFGGEQKKTEKVKKK